ncbi:MAG: glycogen debranching protein GlgX [Nocardioidaceae bacterium]
MTYSERPGTVWRGHHRLGATPDDQGTNFAVWAPDADRVDLCLFDEAGTETRLALPERTLGVWHGYVPGIRPGQPYGYRVSGPWEPALGHLFSPDKLLLDPYTRAVHGELTPHHSVAGMSQDGTPNPGDSAPYVPRSVVVGDDHFDWGNDRRPEVPWRRAVIYEAHVRGLTMLHPEVPEPIRGTYAGLAHPAIIDYLVDLGITSLELLPVQHFLTEPMVSAHGLTNYWGYNPIAFFAPHAAYSSTGSRGEQVTEFKQMVKALHAAGIEVLLDVVYNHSAEHNRLGPSLAFRGYDDGSYYQHDTTGRYRDFTGCGNTLNVSEPQVLQLVMDSLRYWVTEMHVDGFRFDLASALARTDARIDLHAPFLTAVHQDPVLREVKLVAEPWDVTWEGYLVGQFPPPWCEWNDKYRDAVRDFWRGQSGGVRDLASRVSGSSDLYADDGRLPFHSVNFVTAHDGFTLRDLVSYDHKHNDENGEDNRDGTDNNRSWNCGIEGETRDPDVLALRHRQTANMMATLLLSTGVPMITAGDERGRTQRGNNNPYCQDNEISWVDWREDPNWRHLHDLTRTLLDLRGQHPVLRQRHFFQGAPLDEDGPKDISWIRPDGQELTPEDWADTSAATLGIFLAGDALRWLDSRGQRKRDTSYLIWMHAGPRSIDVVLPKTGAEFYREVVRTDRLAFDTVLEAGTTISLVDRSLAVLEVVDPDQDSAGTAPTDNT